MTDSNLKKRVAIGTLWVLLLRVTLRGIGLISTMILARILVPEDYGLIAMGFSVYMLIEMLAAFGFDMVLVQKTELTKSDYDSTWTARLICYSVLSVVLALTAGYAAEFYAEPRITPIIQALAVQMFLSGLENIALVDFRRDLLFDKEFKYKVTVKIIGFCITIPLAFYLENYWALIWGGVISKAASVVLSYYYRPYKPAICFEKTKEIFDFSKWLLMMNMAQFFRSQLPNMVLGKYISSTAVGVYSIGTEIARFSSQELVAAMNRPVYSGFAKLKDDPKELAKNYLEVVGFQSFIVLPLGFGLSASAEFAVKVMLGLKWVDVIEPISILALSVALSSISSCCQYVYLVSGKPRLSFTVSMVGLAIFAPLVIMCVQTYGVMGVVYAHFVSNVITAALNFWLVSRNLVASMSDIISVLLRPICSALTMHFVLSQYITPVLSGNIESSVVALLVAVFSGAAIYGSMTFGLWVLQGRPESAEAIALNLIKDKIAK
jgi:lipopolysaccharide exporter